MKQCPACKREMKEHLLYCPFDGQALVNKNEKDGLIGTIIDDKYRIEEKVGEGGMGKVYRAVHIHMDYTVAIKILHVHLSSDAIVLERFRREARATAQIRHPNAVAVTDFGVAKESGIAYLVMEFLEGLELREKLKQKKHLDYDELYLIVHQTCSALQAAHSKDIIHRDLKPDNIWLFKTPDGSEHVKVLDFGIAKLKQAPDTGNLTQQGMIVGTPYYMSPEQCRGEELDARSDIYSLGIILYEMVTGHVPFQATTPMGVVLKHANEQPRPPHETRPDVPIPIEEVILRALSKDRESRQESAMQLAQELEAAMFEAGVEFKMLGTTTPQSPFSMLSFPPGTFKTGETRQARQTGPSVKALGAAVKTPTDAGASTPVSTARGGAGTNLSGQYSTGAIDKVQTSFIQIATRKKALIAAAAIAILAIVGIWWFARSGARVAPPDQPPTDNSTATNAPPAGMVYIAAGKFLMGNQASDDEFEKPEHEVSVRPFFLDKNEVTVADYYKFIQATNRPVPEGWPAAWKRGQFEPSEARLPVTGVTWYDASDYAKWAGKRLPTESEWEYAVRGTDKRRLYPWGDSFDMAKTNVENRNVNKPAAVGSFPADQTGAGVFDMAGNVAEWTDSDPSVYPGSKATPGSGKIVRGGSYYTMKVTAMATSRLVLPPNMTKDYVGFRCAKNAP